MTSTDEGFVKKYNVVRLDGKPVGLSFVMELKDPNTHDAMLTYANTVEKQGYYKLAEDIRNFIESYKHARRS